MNITKPQVFRNFYLKFSRPFILLLVLFVFEMAKSSSIEKHDVYVVLVDGEPTAFRRQIETPNRRETVDSESELYEAQKKHVVESHNRLLESNLDPGTYRKLYSFHHILNGFAIHTTPSQAKRLGMAPEVLKIEKDRRTKLTTTYTPHLLDLPRGVWAQEGGEEHAGEGIVVGVIDTGIDPSHPSFAYSPSSSSQSEPFLVGACEIGVRFPVGSCNGKILSARYFASGAAAVLPLDRSRDLSPFDVVGHGSHVASIAAGNSGIPVAAGGFVYGFASGMAPRARLRVYKAMYPAGGTTADLVSAIDQAAQDGVDVLVLSIGPDEPPEDTITFMSMFDISLLLARRAGIFVVQAAGNKGPGEASVVSFSPWVVGVGAGTTGRSYGPTLVLGSGHQIQGVGLSAPTPGDGLFQFRLISARDAAAAANVGSLADAEECQHREALQPAKVHGSIVVCSFLQGFLNGSSTVTAIIDTASTLGFVGFVLVANALYGDFIAQPLPFPIPGIMIPRVTDSKALWEYYENQTSRDVEGAILGNNASAAIKDGRVPAFVGSAQAPVVARFSSRGPDIVDRRLRPADVLKPDILAPGQQIWAAWSPISAVDPILSGRHFALLSGTSMAAPHVGGVAALIKQLHPSWTPSMIASAISTTADKHSNAGMPIMAEGAELHSVYPATPFDYGAGFINPAKALDPGLVLQAEFEDYVGFLCSLPTLTPGDVRAATGAACKASLTSPTDLNLPSITISNLRGSRQVRRFVKNVAGKSETYSCSVVPPEGVAVSVRPPWFSIAPQGTQSLEIRFNVTAGSNAFSFGEIVVTGSLDHIVRLTLAALPIAVK